MRINTDGKKEFREDLYERAGEIFDESTKVGGIDRACKHAREDIEAKQEALDWIEANLPPEQAHELCEILSTREMRLAIATETVLQTE